MSSLGAGSISSELTCRARRILSVISCGSICSRKKDGLVSYSAMEKEVGPFANFAVADRLLAPVDGLPVFILSEENLIRNKRSVERPQDLADLSDLED
jgi:hypothetical protein